MSKLTKSLKTAAVGLAVVGVASSLWVWNKLPVRNGELALDNLAASVNVHYDEWGIPHIYAEKDLDGFRALGFVHGQDRLLQMDLLRRVGNGELSALIGEKAVNVDKTFRTFGTHLIAKKRTAILKETDPEAVAKLEAYYDGVNQAIDKLPTPIEYSLLGAQPEHFKLEDAYGISAYMAHSFLAGFKTDPLLTAVQQSVSAEHFSDVVLDWPETITATSTVNLQAADSSSIITDEQAASVESKLPQDVLLALADAGQAIAEALPFGAVHGSNGWAISSDKSEGELPIFANDPHMQFSTPAVWYEAQLKTDKRNIYGHFAAGVPFPLLMRSENRIHGLTMLQSDDADIIALTADTGTDEQPLDNVMIEGKWEAVESRQETIQVKGGEPVEFTVRTTSLGSIVNDVMAASKAEETKTSDEHSEISKLDTVEEVKTVTEQFVFYWLFTDPKNDVVSMMHNTMQSDDLESMEKALAPHMSPGLNVIYADRSNNIAMWATGRFIKRHPGQTGKTIVNGSLPNSIPLGVYDFAENPKLINPEQGYIFSTNNPYPGSDPAFKHTGYYSPIYRALIADEALLNDDNWTVEKSKALQTTTYNARWGHSKLLLTSVLNENKWSDIESQAITALKQWDGNYNGDSLAASIFERFYFHLMSALYTDELGQPLFDKFVTNGIADNTLYQLIKQPESVWWDNADTEETETQNDIIKYAFSNAVASLSAEFGNDVKMWDWQTTAGLTHPHPLGKVWPLNHLFNVGEFVVNGSKRALNNMIHTFTDEKIQITNGPSTRRVVDLSDMRSGWNINPVGQSGRWLDKHYASQSALYHNNEYRRSLLLSDDDELLATMETLVLKPSGK
jgi:penicillin amidase